MRTRLQARPTRHIFKGDTCEHLTWPPGPVGPHSHEGGHLCGRTCGNAAARVFVKAAEDATTRRCAAGQVRAPSRDRRASSAAPVLRTSRAAAAISALKLQPPKVNVQRSTVDSRAPRRDPQKRTNGDTKHGPPRLEPDVQRAARAARTPISKHPRTSTRPYPAPPPTIRAVGRPRAETQETPPLHLDWPQYSSPTMC